jgi:hypothetical protein
MARGQDEKEEKHQEKEEEKRHEKDHDEKWRHNPLGAAIWALILIWAGIVFLAQNMGLLAGFERLSPWSLVLAGAGVLLLLEVLVRLVVPEYRRPVIGTLIVGLVLLAAGVGSLQNWWLLWPILLIAAGVALLLGFITRRR